MKIALTGSIPLEAGLGDRNQAHCLLHRRPVPGVDPPPLVRGNPELTLAVRITNCAAGDALDGDEEAFTWLMEHPLPRTTLETLGINAERALKRFAAEVRRNGGRPNDPRPPAHLPAPAAGDAGPKAHPGAVVDLARQLAGGGSLREIRELTHSAETEDRINLLTPVLIVLITVVMGARYLSRGFDDPAFYLIASAAYVIAIVLRPLLRRRRAG
jgi:hypothetical protein